VPLIQGTFCSLQQAHRFQKHVAKSTRLVFYVGSRSAVTLALATWSCGIRGFAGSGYWASRYIRIAAESLTTASPSLKVGTCPRGFRAMTSGPFCSSAEQKSCVSCAS